jgi:succinyl-CoA synthetase alpha subunit
MATVNIVKPNRYQDSVTLMQVAGRVREFEGIEDAALMMGTAPNKEMLFTARLLAAEGGAAGPNDLIIALRGEDEAIEAVQAQLEELLTTVAPDTRHPTPDTRPEPHTLAEGVASMPNANLVLISTPGIYAAAEARKALAHGRHVMIFSDNVSLDDEYELKKEAVRRGLMLMGPDSGTAIVGGVPLGFANAVRRGSIGVVGASGTGMQEITSLIDRYGGGISHAIGTGSRDLSERIGGEMTATGLRALLDDLDTATIVLVSKPPHPEAAQNVLSTLVRTAKTVVVTFLGTAILELPPGVPPDKVWQADTLEDAALLAAESLGMEIPEGVDEVLGPLEEAQASLEPRRRYIRGLFSGGTFCYEAMLIMRERLGGIYSNTPLSEGWELPDAHTSHQHTCLDMGADEFTVGRPHPMIDQTARIQRLMAEAADEHVSVLLLDVVLGYGAHPDPAGELAVALNEARKRAQEKGDTMPAIVASICGTERDPQGLKEQRQKLLDVGVIVAPSNATAAGLAVAITDREAL